MNDSRRSAVHFTGRPSCFDAQETVTSSGYRKILDPNPPPTSPEITRTLCSGIPSTNAAMSSRWTWGFWEVTQQVSSPIAELYEAIEARGSIALGIRRWLIRRCLTTLCAPLMAASVVALSPMFQLKATLPGALSWIWGAPRWTAFSPSVTAGSTS